MRKLDRSLQIVETIMKFLCRMNFLYHLGSPRTIPSGILIFKFSQAASKLSNYSHLYHVGCIPVPYFRELLASLLLKHRSPLSLASQKHLRCIVVNMISNIDEGGLYSLPAHMLAGFLHREAVKQSTTVAWTSFLLSFTHNDGFLYLDPITQRIHHAPFSLFDSLTGFLS
jgi:hypothetical protein